MPANPRLTLPHTILHRYFELVAKDQVIVSLHFFAPRVSQRLPIASLFAFLVVSVDHHSYSRETGQTYSAVVVTTLWVVKVEKEHAEHTEHLKHENGGELPETPAYDYLNKRGSCLHALCTMLLLNYM